MRLKEKFYRRFCAPEVRMLLDHMEENFQDFEDDYLNRKAWVRLMNSDTYTTVERTVIKMAYQRLKGDHARQQLLGKIIAQKLSPAPEVSLPSQPPQGLTAMKASQQQHLMAQQQYASQYNQGAASYHMDPRTIFGNVP
jgi:hypothetical protein